MKENSRIETLLEPTVTAMGYEWVGCQYIPQGRSGLLRIFIDRPNGITLDDCTAVSRQVSALLDVNDPIAGHYRLEVSSPGLERPLFNLTQVSRFIGQLALFRLHTPREGRRNFQGKIEGVHEGNIQLQVDEQQVSLLWSDVSRANLVQEKAVVKKVKK